MRILLIEDEREMAAWLVRALRQSGFVTDHAPDARTGEGLLQAGIDYDAVVLDLGLPDKNGLAVLAQLRDRGNAAPVLILTAQGTLQDRVRGLNLGPTISLRSRSPSRSWRRGWRRWCAAATVCASIACNAALSHTTAKAMPSCWPVRCCS
jgi:CheY-like chemotaxis protein